jgi:hypothetical protein
MSRPSRTRRLVSALLATAGLSLSVSNFSPVPASAAEDGFTDVTVTFAFNNYAWQNQNFYLNYLGDDSVWFSSNGGGSVTTAVANGSYDVWSGASDDYPEQSNNCPLQLTGEAVSCTVTYSGRTDVESVTYATPIPVVAAPQPGARSTSSFTLDLKNYGSAAATGPLYIYTYNDEAFPSCTKVEDYGDGEAEWECDMTDLAASSGPDRSRMFIPAAGASRPGAGTSAGTGDAAAQQRRQERMAARRVGRTAAAPVTSAVGSAQAKRPSAVVSSDIPQPGVLSLTIPFSVPADLSAGGYSFYPSTIDDVDETTTYWVGQPDTGQLSVTATMNDSYSSSEFGNDVSLEVVSSTGVETVELTTNPLSLTLAEGSVRIHPEVVGAPKGAFDSSGCRASVWSLSDESSSPNTCYVNLSGQSVIDTSGSVAGSVLPGGSGTLTVNLSNIGPEEGYYVDMDFAGSDLPVSIAQEPVDAPSNAPSQVNSGSWRCYNDQSDYTYCSWSGYDDPAVAAAAHPETAATASVELSYTVPGDMDPGTYSFHIRTTDEDSTNYSTAMIQFVVADPNTTTSTTTSTTTTTTTTTIVGSATSTTVVPASVAPTTILVESVPTSGQVEPSTTVIVAPTTIAAPLSSGGASTGSTQPDPVSTTIAQGCAKGTGTIEGFTEQSGSTVELYDENGRKCASTVSGSTNVAVGEDVRSFAQAAQVGSTSGSDARAPFSFTGVAAGNYSIVVVGDTNVAPRTANVAVLGAETVNVGLIGVEPAVAGTGDLALTGRGSARLAGFALFLIAAGVAFSGRRRIEQDSSQD